MGHAVMVRAEPAAPTLHRAVAPLVIALTGLANTLAVPLVNNQNQYLAHAVGERSPGLRADWLISTTDPYPFFTRAVGLLVDWGGDLGLRFVTYLATVVALTGVYLIARSISDSRGVPVLTVLVLGATLVAFPTAPLDALSVFHSLAGQYLISKPGYLQPSSAGVLLLLALGLWRSAHGRRWPWMAAVGLIVLACAIHPTYALVAGIGLAAAWVADVVTGRGTGRLPGYLGIAVAAAGAAIAGNPAVLAPVDGAVRERFAFERIAHHTLVSSWRWYDLAYLGLILLAAWLARPLRGGPWIAAWLVAATVPGVLAVLVVEYTRWTELALLFPWRITVLTVPIAATVLVVRLGEALRRPRPYAWRVPAVAAAALLAGYGLYSTAQAQSPESLEPTALVLTAQPEGVGLVPLLAQDVRLNAEVPIYVDWKSAPYLGDDLAQWWLRYDQVAAFERDPESFCKADWAAGIDWVLLPAGAQVSCLQDWPLLGESAGYVVRQRPTLG